MTIEEVEHDIFDKSNPRNIDDLWDIMENILQENKGRGEEDEDQPLHQDLSKE